MLAYFQEYYIGLARGVSYIPTQIATIVAVVLLLSDTELSLRGIAKKTAECAVCFGVYLLLTSAAYALFGDIQLDRVTLTLFTAGYAVVRSKYRARVRFVRSMVYIADYMVIFAVTEPIGVLLSGLNQSFWGWGQHMTWITVILLLFAIVWFLRHFSTQKSSPVGMQFVVLLVSVMIIASQLIYLALGGEDITSVAANYKQYNQIVGFFLLVIEMLTYYLYYSVVTVTRENLNLLTMQHKAAMEEEKFQANRVNYDDLRMLRHELKNHSFYMRSLLDAGKYEELKEYLRRGEDSEMDRLQSFDCGNYVVDVVMNHAVNKARQQRVTIEPQIVVPHQLPYDDRDICSLLSNLMDNALEAAVQSGEEQPKITISMLPRQDYLFIHVTNSVSQAIPAQQRLTLKTTKQRYDIHGYGTKVIRTVAEKYNGTVNFSMADGRFVTDVMLELPQDPQEEKA